MPNPRQQESPFVAPLVSIGCALLMLLLGGCPKYNTPGNPTPTPSPTATPFPFPTATPNPTATPTPTPVIAAALAADSAGGNVAQQVAKTNADIVAAAAQDALKKAGNLEQVIRDVIASPDPDHLTAANAALSSARLAFAQAEAAVFYSDPASPDELAALPDSLNITSSSGQPQKFDALADLLTQYSTAATAETGQSLVNGAHELTGDLKALVAAWKPADPDNFRNRFFLPSSDEAVARILQGLTTVTGDALPARLRGVDLTGATTGQAISSGEAAAALAGIQNLYLGTYQVPDGKLISGSGLKAAIDQIDPGAAQGIEGALANAAQLAQQLDSAPTDAATQQALQDALSDITQRLTNAAATLGVTFATSR